MGIEVVFILIYPVVLVCLPAAFMFWLYALRVDAPTVGGYIEGYIPLFIGFTTSLIGLMILAYISTSAHLAWLVDHGYYTEFQRSEYMLSNTVSQFIVFLVLFLPGLCFVIIPLTTKLIRTHHLTISAIAIRLAIIWIAHIFLLWFTDLPIHPHDPVFVILRKASIIVLIVGLPVPLSAFWFFRRKWKMSGIGINDRTPVH